MLQRLRSLLRTETRSTGRLDDALTAAILGGWGPTSSGVTITPETALRSTAVFGAVRVLAETVQQLPLHLYRKLDNGGRERAEDHPVESLVSDIANPWTPASEFRLTMQTDLSLRLNAFAYVGRTDGQPVELIHVPANAVAVETDRVTMEPRYKVTDAGGNIREYTRSEMLHLRGFGTGCRGLSPIEHCREAIGLSMVMEKYAGGLFGRGGRPAGMIKTKKKLTPDALERLRISFERIHQGADNAGRTIILEEDQDFTATQLSSVDAQFLEMRKFQLQEICRIFRVPPHLLADLERSTFSNAETMGQTFLTYCLLPILRTWTDALRITLLTPDERKTMYFEFEINDLARADLAARFTAYSQAIACGLLNPNEARAMENKAPYKGGEVYTRPVNSAPVQGTKPSVVPNAA
jgi:HK97 family phage portal protein